MGGYVPLDQKSKVRMRWARIYSNSARLATHDSGRLSPGSVQRLAHPRSCSFRIRRAITAAFVLPLLLPTHHAILPPPPSQGPWSACIRAVPSVALSLTAADQCVVHHCSWHHFSRDQHFVEHLNCIFDTATPAPPKITVA
jgi:hypothetical protein